jgi:glycine dehydrogenase subunit 1
MDFISNSETQVKEMLAALQVESIEELFQDVPRQIWLDRPMENDGLSEYEGIKRLEEIAAENRFPFLDNYLGAGAYEHHVPALISAVVSKSEFLTSYTPYQAEASQGMLQAIFEFQSAICALTGMDVSNASVYDGASACAEAALMSLRHKKGSSKILVAETLHPHYLAVIKLYTEGADAEIVAVSFEKNGQLDISALEEQLDDRTACVIVQSPNFVGAMEDIPSFSAKIQDSGALLVLAANPMSYGIYRNAAELGADIAIGETQPFGLPLQFGGPYAGYIACRQELVRQLPGRIVGETVDTKGNRGFVLTLQAREQHIRRDKATSNICTNQALAALACLVGILWYGKQGVKETALTNFQRASYLKSQLEQIAGVTTIDSPIFNEFAVHFGKPYETVWNRFEKEGVACGVDLGRYYPALKDYCLVAVTETKSKSQLDRYIDIAKEVAR